MLLALVDRKVVQALEKLGVLEECEDGGRKLAKMVGETCICKVTLFTYEYTAITQGDTGIASSVSVELRED